jgi:uncharacterized caspase-like protein
VFTASLLSLGCATPPKPRELSAIEQLRANPDMPAARKKAPLLCNMADKAHSAATEKWQSNDLGESVEQAILGGIYYQQAITLAQQDNANQRITAAEDALSAAAEEQQGLQKDLDNENYTIGLLQKAALEKNQRSQASQGRSGDEASGAAPVSPAMAPSPMVPGLPVRAPGSPEPALVANIAIGVPQRSNYALIVGIERYRDLPAAPGAKADAERYRVIAAQTLGLPAAHVRVAIDERATKTDIERHLEWLRENVTATSRVYFFYSGHGAPDPSSGTPYLVPYDADANAIKDSALPLAKVLGELEHSKASEVLAFVDSCFSGQGGRSVLPPGTRPLVVTSAVPQAKKVVLFSAASGREISGPAPGNQGGLFSYFVFQALGQGAADMDGDGQITARELQNWLKPRVARAAKQDGREQNPDVQAGKSVRSLDELPVLWGLETK